jgi:hypothetical protein
MLLSIGQPSHIYVIAACGSSMNKAGSVLIGAFSAANELTLL